MPSLPSFSSPPPYPWVIHSQSISSGPLSLSESERFQGDMVFPHTGSRPKCVGSYPVPLDTCEIFKSIARRRLNVCEELKSPEEVGYQRSFLLSTDFHRVKSLQQASMLDVHLIFGKSREALSQAWAV